MIPPNSEIERGAAIREPGQLLRLLEQLLARSAEIPCVLLTVAEVALLFGGVLSRYLFDSPLVWGNEAAETLFLWLAMFGSAVALDRGLHMRMTAAVNGGGDRWRFFWESIALAASLLFLVLAFAPSLSYTKLQGMIRMPATGMSAAWRDAAMPAGIAWMILICTVKLLILGRKSALPVLLGVVLVGGGLYIAGPVFRPLGNYNLVIFFVMVLGLAVFSGMAIAFSFGLATFSYLMLTTSVPLGVVISRMDEGMSGIILLAIPMFIFLGLLIEMTGMAHAMIRFLDALVGHVRGGLSYVLIGAMFLISGISGSKVADMAAIVPTLFPEMIKRGEKPGELVALISATGAQTDTIPPSIVLIVMGSITGVSIAALFTGGIMPAVVLGLGLCMLVGWRSRRSTSVRVGQRASYQTILRTFVVAVPALVLPFIIRFAVVTGIATATEVATVGVVYCIIVGTLIYRRFPVNRLWPILTETAALSGAILLIIGVASAMGWALAQSGFSHSLAAAMESVPGGKTAFLVESIVAFVILGSILEGIPAIVLFGPLLFPIAREMGIHEVQYAMVAVLSMGLGLFSPPVGIGYYGACIVSKIDPGKGMRPMVKYIVVLLIGIGVIAAVPWFSIGFL